MLYAKYTKRMTRVAAFNGWVRKFKIPIIIVMLLLVATVATLLGTRGIIFDSVACPSSIEYGSAFEYRAGAFMGDVAYEFRAEGETEWTTEQPIRAGKYYVRAVSARTFGIVSYGKVHEFTIVPKVLDINVAATVLYGEKPEYSAETAYDDVLTCTEFEYADLSQQVTQVNAVADSVSVTDANGDDVTASYDVNPVISDIVFISRDIEITVESVSFIYDGEKHSSSAWELTGGTLAEGDMIVPVFDKTQTDVGEVENTPQISVTHKVLNEDGFDVSANYNITQKAGLLSVQKRTVVIDSLSSTHEYDDQPFTYEQFTISDDTPVVEGHRAEVVSSVFQRDVGSRANVLGFKLYDALGNEVTDNYNIIVNEGEIEVTPREITVRSGNSEKIYDGVALENRSCSLIDGTTLVSGHSLRITSATSITDAGETENMITVDIIAADGVTVVSSNYNCTYAPGTLKISPRTVTVTTGDAMFFYDGNEQWSTYITVSGILTELGHGYNIVGYTKLKDVLYSEGEITDTENIIYIEIVGTDPDNYNIVGNYGSAIMYRRTVNVTAASDEWDYDGDEHFDNTFTVDPINDMAQGETLVVTNYTTVTDVVYDEAGEIASIPNTLDFEISGGKIENYDLRVTDGTLTVYPRAVDIVTNTNAWVYDGDEHFDKGWSVAQNSIYDFVYDHSLAVGDHTVVKNVLRKENDPAGEVLCCDNILELTLTGTLAGNYNISVNYGTLTITPYLAWIRTHSAEKVYDGTALTDDRFAVTTTADVPAEEVYTSSEAELAKNEFVRLKTSPLPTVTHVVDSKNNELELEFVNVDLSNYVITYIYGTLTVKPYEIWIWTHSAEKVYDGTALTDDKFAVTTSATAPDDGAYTSTPKTLANASETLALDTTAALPTITHVKRGADGKTAVGIDNALSLGLVGGIDSDYKINGRTDGKLIVKPFGVYVYTHSSEREYNGTPLTDDKFAALTYLTIQTSAENKNYDNKAFALVNGETLYYDTSITDWLPSITDVKRGADGKTVESIKNEIKFTVVGGVISDYDIAYDYGTLTVTPIEINITTASNGNGSGYKFGESGEKQEKWIYDGSTRFDKDYQADRQPIVGDSFSVQSFTSVTNAETKSNILHLNVYRKVTTGSSVSTTLNTHNYDLIYTYGTLTVSKRPVTVKTHDAKKVYDDTELICTDYTVTSSLGFVGGQNVVVYTWTTITNAGSADNVLVLKVYNDTAKTVELTKNYDITYKYDDTHDYGTLTVTKRVIIVKTPDKTVVYDGTAQSSTENIVTDTTSPNTLVVGHEFTTDDYTTRTDAGSVTNEMTVSVVKPSSARAWSVAEDKTGNYTIEYVYGTITVQKRTVSVMPASATKVYDGYPLTASFVCREGEGLYDIAPKQRGEIECSGSQTDVGSCPNVFVEEDLHIFDNKNNDVTYNYNISYINQAGTLTVTKRPITLASYGTEDDERYYNGDYWVYDGTPKYYHECGFLFEPDEKGNPHPDKGLVFDKTDGGYLYGRHVIVPDEDSWASFTNAFVYLEKNTFTARIVEPQADGTQKDVTHNYDISYQYGTLIIQPRPVTVLTNSNTWVYDGDAHYDEGWSICPSSQYGFVLDHTLNVTGHTEITDVGAVDNVLSVELVNSLPLNYTITVEYGTLEITPRSVIIKTPTLQKVYDDTPLMNDGTATAENLVEGHIAVYTPVPISITNVSESPAINYIILARIEDANGNDVTHYYEPTYEYGLMIIEPRTVKIETASNVWQYDGISHYDDRFDIIEGSIADGHEISVYSYTEIRDIGIIDNVLTFVVRKGDDDKTSNYNIVVEYGILEIIESDDPVDPDDPDLPPDPGPPQPDNPDYPTPAPGDTLIMRVLSDKDFYLYLRESSSGDYISGTSWDAAPEYTGSKINYNGNNYTVNYLPNVIMSNSGFEVATTQVERLYTPYSVPYFATFDSANTVMTSDVEYTNSATEYTYKHYNYNYISDNGAALTGGLGIYSNTELAYRSFVYDNYLTVSQSTREYLQGIIDQRRFRKENATVVKDVAAYIQNSAEYNMLYDTALDSEPDTVVSFLRDYKEGVCRHYATAATLLFRTLGIPARYTVGVAAKTTAGEWVEVTAYDRHAWVEVYLDGIGWINVEVTGGARGTGNGVPGSGDGDPDDGDPSDPQDPDEMKPTLEIKPVDLSVEYDGREHFAPQEAEDANGGDGLAQLLENGYRYFVKVTGSRVDYGTSESSIESFYLYDASGANVTSEFDITYQTGAIHVTRTQLHINLMNLSKTYDGAELRFEPLVFGDYVFPIHTLVDPPAGIVSVDIDYSMLDGITNAGYLGSMDLELMFEAIYEENSDFIHVYDANGNDLANNYSIVVDSGSLKVEQRIIVFASDSATKVYDGTPLTADSCHVSRGSLVDGHTYEAVIVGSVTEVTTAPAVNRIRSVNIYDTDGNDVTDNYDVRYDHGSLTVTPET